MKTSKRLLSLILMTTLLLTMIPTTAQAAKAFKLSWNANGGKIGAKKTVITVVKAGAKIGKLPATPKYTGYAFKGWFTQKLGGEKVTKNTKPVKNTTYFAQWAAKEFTLKFDPTGGSVSPKSKKVEFKQRYGDLPIPTRSGYTFEGWYTTKTGRNKVSDSTKMVAKNVTIYAHWKKGATPTPTDATTDTHATTRQAV